jgi:hypothetical protein
VPGGFDHYFAACAEEWSEPEPDLQYLDKIAAKIWTGNPFGGGRSQKKLVSKISEKKVYVIAHLQARSAIRRICLCSSDPRNAERRTPNAKRRTPNAGRRLEQQFRQMEQETA